MKKLGSILSAAIFLTLTSCAPSAQQETRLPDDPTVEATPGETGADQSEQFAQLPEIEMPRKEDEAKILANYDYVDPTNLIPDNLLKKAILYYDQNLNSIKNKTYLSVIDFSKSSKYKRFFIINMSTGAVWAIRTAHGKNSDPNHDGYADTFSNKSGSNQSSLGFYRAAETYNGSNGYSLRLDGLSPTNSNARPRAVVIHGSNYVKEADVIQGRSWGCPAVAQENRDALINRIKNGSIIYAGLSASE